MGKRYFEIFLVIGVLFLIIHFIFYTFFLDNICKKYSNNNVLTQENILFRTSSCKDTLVCNLHGVKLEKNVQVVDWQCTKKRIGIYEPDFYISKIKKFID